MHRNMETVGHRRRRQACLCFPGFELIDAPLHRHEPASIAATARKKLMSETPEHFDLLLDVFMTIAGELFDRGQRLRRILRATRSGAAKTMVITSHRPSFWSENRV